MTPAMRAQRISALLKQILATLQKNEPRQSVQALAGRLSQQISQSESDCSISQAALGQAASSLLSREARSALRQVTAALARCQTGTGALRNGQTTVSQGTSLSTGGGTSNYTQP